MIYFDSDMSKSTNTVLYFDWKMVIYIYGIFFFCWEKWNVIDYINRMLGNTVLSVMAH
jgi:hypothetical protein